MQESRLSCRRAAADLAAALARLRDAAVQAAWPLQSQHTGGLRVRYNRTMHVPQRTHSTYAALTVDKNIASAYISMSGTVALPRFTRPHTAYH